MFYLSKEVIVLLGLMVEKEGELTVPFLIDRCSLIEEDVEEVVS